MTTINLSENDRALIVAELAADRDLAAAVANEIGEPDASEIASHLDTSEIASELNATDIAAENELSDAVAANLADNGAFIGAVADGLKVALSDNNLVPPTADNRDRAAAAGTPNPYAEANPYGIDRAKTPAARSEFLKKSLIALADVADADGGDNGRRLANAARALSAKVGGGLVYVKLNDLADAARYIAATAVNENSPLSACGLGDDGDGYEPLKECATALTANAVLADARDDSDRKALTACGLALFALVAVSDLPSRDGDGLAYKPSESDGGVR